MTTTESDRRTAREHLRAAVIQCQRSGVPDGDVLACVAPLLQKVDPESREPYPTTVSYGGGEFGGPCDVYINGQRVQAVQKITVESEVEQYSKVTVVLGGVLVSVSPRVDS